MFVPLGVKTDYSLYKSLIKIEDLILYAQKNNLNTLGILDDNLCSSNTFINTCKKNNIKPIIGLDIVIDNYRIFFYPKNYNGLKVLFRLSRFMLDNNISIGSLKDYHDDIIVVLPNESYSIYDVINKIYDKVFLSFKSEKEMLEAKIITNDIIYINDIYCLSSSASKFVNYLDMILNNKKLGDYSLVDYSSNVIDILDYDVSVLTDLIDLTIDNNKRYIPHFSDDIEDSFVYLKNLAYKGLNKRLNNKVDEEYTKRLEYELSVIKKMQFEDYFLIVFDYVRFAKKNGIFVGAGRGSAVGSLVSYALGITNLDPLEYDLLFERFLNPDRVTMPDIDVDFEDVRREEVVNYIKDKYGIENVGHIMTYGTMTAKEVLRCVAKINNVDDAILNSLLKHINSKISLKDNLTTEVKNILEHNSILNKVYRESYFLEGIKHHVGTHAAGVVISSIPLSQVVPIIKSGDEYLIGYQKDELEDLGLIKMDLLSVKNLTILSNALKDLKSKGIDLNIDKIPLDDSKVFDLFKSADTVGVFQFETSGMKNFLKRAKPNIFSDLVVIQAMFRPGPMQSIDEFLKRKNEGKKIEYLDKKLEPILKDTYGILLYQEQIMEILRSLGGFSYSEADIIRRAISKKKLDTIKAACDKFIKSATINGVSEDAAKSIFDLILKFAEFGFNKSHSVAYSYIAYQMAYLKVYYPNAYYINLLNTNIGGEAKTKEYIESAKKCGIKILKPDINKSGVDYISVDDGIVLPIRVIKGIGVNIASEIIENRDTLYQDFFDFVSRVKINKNVLVNLIDAGTMDSFGYNRETLKYNIDSALTYAELTKEIDSSLVSKPEMVIKEETSEINIMNRELELYGYYVSSHPSSKYPDLFKQIDIEKNFNKIITTVVLIERINKIKTKNNKDMAFITASDETVSGEFVYFDFNDNVRVGDLVKIVGRVERRFDKYQIVINKIEKV